jgi:DNA transposition AAA+ family ATPase
MSDTSKPRKWGEEEIEAVVRRVDDLVRAEDMTRKQVAAESGVAYGTLTPFLGGTYAGDRSRIAEKLEIYLASRGKREAIRAAVPAAGFVATPTATAIHDLLAHAQGMPDMVVITGAPGTGKTFAACAYTRGNPNVWKLVASPALNSTRALLGELASLLGVYDAGSQYRIARDVMRRLSGTQSLIIIDEAQHLTSAMLDQLRAFHDQSPCGIALLGNDAVVGRLEGGRRSAEYAQLTSRVGMRMKRRAPQKGDVVALLDAWGATGAPRDALAGVAKQAGGLRSMHKTWRLASMLARAETRELVAEDIDMAWKRLASGAALAGEGA